MTEDQREQVGWKGWVGFVACLLPFLVYKLDDLKLPYFWDEAAVYARAALYLYDHGLGLLPKYLPPELSRGHPLLFSLSVASVFRIFGPGLVVAHLFMLVVSVGLLASVFWVTSRHWGPAAGLIATILLMVQPLFVAQSTLVLPEVALGLTSLWTLHALFCGRYRAAGLFLAIALFLKETAVALDAIVLLVLCIRWLKCKPGLKTAVAQALPAVAANLLCIGYFVAQRLENGWFFFPEHVGYVHFHYAAWMCGLRTCLFFLFVEQGRAVLSAIVLVWVIGRWRRLPQTSRAGFLFVLLLFTVAVLAFSSGNVFMRRYLLCLLPPLAIAGGHALVELAARKPWLLALGTASVCLASLFHLTSSRFNYEDDMSLREAVRMQQEATEFVATKVGVDQAIVANFPACAGLEDPRFGYASQRFSRLAYKYAPGTEFVFASEIFERFQAPLGVRMDLVRRFSSPYMNLALYHIGH